MHPGWGDKMNELFVECDKRGIEWRGLSGWGFAQQMDDLTGLRGTGALLAEEAADLWLNALRNNP